MTTSDDDPIASWQERIGSLRKRVRISTAALTVVSAEEIDACCGRPPAPERLSAEERELWERLNFGRRPGWFAGAEEVLEAYARLRSCKRSRLRCAGPDRSRARVTKSWRGCG